ncbi:MAG TPA: alpha/beta hydrolase [Chitinophagaceae bacterium]|nr:alpha/beta hydrolase [Chitinophagaceae bacterium]
MQSASNAQKSGSILVLLGLAMLVLWRSGQGQSVPYQATGHYYASFDGTRIYYETAGSGPAVVLLHGFANTGEVWKKIALYQELQQAGFELIIPDLRGNGKSDKPHNPAAYLRDAEARDVMGILKRMGIHHYGLVGYSRGSIIAARLLVLDPRVTRVVLGGMGPGFTDPAWPRRIMFYRALMGDSVPELAPLVRYVQQQGLDRRALALQQFGQPSTSPKELAAVRKPVLVICGDQDQDNGSGKALAALIPGAQFRTVPGDHPGAMHSAQFSSLVATFLEGKEL